jgi:hypothetical protein
MTACERRGYLWRIEELARVPACIRGVSFERLLAPITLAPQAGAFDRVILGGESGPGARRCELAWIRALIAECHAAGVRVFVKQLGASAYDGLVRLSPGGAKAAIWPPGRMTCASASSQMKRDGLAFLIPLPARAIFSASTRSADYQKSRSHGKASADFRAFESSRESSPNSRRLDFDHGSVPTFAADPDVGGVHKPAHALRAADFDAPGTGHYRHAARRR